jgi:D-alanyl-D-alanine carboxypeptidase (penicillin-binding protein 5/6)
MVVALVAIVAYVAFTLLRSLPGPTVVTTRRAATLPGPPLRLDWPASGEAAVGVQGVGILGSHGSARPVPIASISKVMTAYVVLRHHPLGGTANGPQITVSSADVAAYRADRAAGQSVVAVRAGERLTERQALEGMLLPSGNNIATLLASWDAGSQSAFVSEMNGQARALGLAQTHYTDASGVLSSSVSTATDQVRLAMQAMALPAFARIVGMVQATLPVAGRQYNVDDLLGHNGIVGIKTGTTSQAGGCFLFAARERVAGRAVTVIGAVLDQTATRAEPSILTAAFRATTPLLRSTRGAVGTRTVVAPGARFGTVTAPGSGQVALRATAGVSVMGWSGLSVHTTIAITHHISTPARAGQALGTATITAGGQRATIRLVTGGVLTSRSIGWRLTHP